MGHGAQGKPAATATENEQHSAEPDENDVGYVWGELQSQNQELPDNIELRLKKITIGRRKESTFPISGPLISGRHCEITREVYEGADAIEVFHITDLSQNGTFLDGVAIGKGHKKVLRHGSTVALPWRVFKDDSDEHEDKLISKLRLAVLVGVHVCVNNHVLSCAIDFEFVKIEKDVFDEDWDGVLEKYDLGRQLGSGAFAVVKHVTEKSTGNEYAMKVLIYLHVYSVICAIVFRIHTVDMDLGRGQGKDGRC